MPKRYPRIEEKRESTRRRLRSLMARIDWDTMVEFVPNTMLAGPCELARKIPTGPIRAADAPITPLEGCTHPDQCACLYGPYLSPDD